MTMEPVPCRQASFALDTFLLLPLCGHLAAGISKRFGVSPRLLMGFTLAGFWAVAGGLYFDWFDFPFLGAAGRGNHFMWNSGVDLLGLPPFFNLSRPSYERFGSPANWIAMSFFLVIYPLAFYAGFRAYSKTTLFPPTFSHKGRGILERLLRQGRKR